MVARLAFFLIALFWVTMNVLLWRAEYGPRDPTGSAVPVSVVWRKILTSPDSSSLRISQHGKRIGFAQWVTSIGEEFARLDEAPPEGMAGKAGNYRIRLDGNVTLPESGSRVRFDCNLKLSTNQIWQELNLRLSARHGLWEIRSVAVEQTLYFKADDGESRFERVFKFSDLQNPQALLGEFAGPLAVDFLGRLGLPALSQTTSPSSLGLKWEAHVDTLQIGHEPVRVYRLQTRVLDRYNVVLMVSRAGEILRVKLPYDVVLTHDPMANY